MQVVIYKAPHGRQEVVDITNVNKEDEEFFNTNNIVISMEEVGGDFVVYADTGYENEDGDPEEFIEIAQGRSCEDVLNALRISCEEFLSSVDKRSYGW